jgi:hypothetical protein
MNTNATIVKIKAELDDQGIFYTDQDVLDALQDIYEDIAFNTSCIEKVVTLTAPATPYWRIRSVVPDYFRCFGIFDRNRGEFIEGIHYWRLKEVHSQWESRTGTPYCWSPIGFDYLSFYPHYAAVPSDNFDVFYAAIAPDLTSSETLQLPPNCREVIVDGVLSMLFLQALELQKAELRLADYEVGLAKVQREMDRRSNSDRLKQMRALYVKL